MANLSISIGTVHKVPNDLRQALNKNVKIIATWNGLTPLARNEWICWVTFVKKAETRQHHIKRLVNEIGKGKRRPCCWMGCMHRKDKQISKSIKKLANGSKT